MAIVQIFFVTINAHMYTLFYYFCSLGIDEAGKVALIIHGTFKILHIMK